MGNAWPTAVTPNAVVDPCWACGSAGVACGRGRASCGCGGPAMGVHALVVQGPHAELCAGRGHVGLTGRAVQCWSGSARMASSSPRVSPWDAGPSRDVALGGPHCCAGLLVSGRSGPRRLLASWPSCWWLRVMGCGLYLAWRWALDSTGSWLRGAVSRGQDGDGDGLSGVCIWPSHVRGQYGSPVLIASCIDRVVLVLSWLSRGVVREGPSCLASGPSWLALCKDGLMVGREWRLESSRVLLGLVSGILVGLDGQAG